MQEDFQKDNNKTNYYYMEAVCWEYTLWELSIKVNKLVNLTIILQD